MHCVFDSVVTSCVLALGNESVHQEATAFGFDHVAAEAGRMANCEGLTAGVALCKVGSKPTQRWCHIHGSGALGCCKQTLKLQRANGICGDVETDCQRRA